MRVREPIEARGFFWRADDTQRRHQVPGTLRVAESGRASVEVFDLIEAPIHEHDTRSLLSYKRHEPLIIGFVEDHGLVTLIECSQSYGPQWQSLATRFTSATYTARSLVKIWSGERYSDFVMQELTLEVEGLTHWLKESVYGAASAPDNDDSAVISSLTYERIDDIEFELSDDTKGAIVSWGTSPELAVLFHPEEVKLQQHSMVKITCQAGWRVDEAIECAVKLQNLVALFMQEPVEVVRLNGASHDKNKRQESSEVTLGSIYYESIPFNPESPGKAGLATLVSLDMVRQDLSLVMQNWWELWEQVPQALNVYFNLVYSEQVDVVESFLSLTRAIESLDRELSGDTKSRFAERLTRRMDSCGKVWLNDVVVEEFVCAVRDARNYWTHFDSKIPTAAGQKAPLLWFCERLEMILTINLLKRVLPERLPPGDLVAKSPWLRGRLELASEELELARGR